MILNLRFFLYFFIKSFQNLNEIINFFIIIFKIYIFFKLKNIIINLFYEIEYIINKENIFINIKKINSL